MEPEGPPPTISASYTSAGSGTPAYFPLASTRGGLRTDTGTKAGVSASDTPAQARQPAQPTRSSRAEEGRHAPGDCAGGGAESERSHHEARGEGGGGDLAVEDLDHWERSAGERAVQQLLLNKNIRSFVPELLPPAGAMPHLCTLLFKPSWRDWAPLLEANKGLLLGAALLLVALPAGRPIQARHTHKQAPAPAQAPAAGRSGAPRAMRSARSIRPTPFPPLPRGAVAEPGRRGLGLTTL